VSTHDRPTGRDADLIAAARAASIWARTRRSTWTNAPLAIPSPPSVVVAAPVPATAHLEPPPRVVTVPKAPAPTASTPQQPSLAGRVADVGRSLGPSAAKWLMRVAGVAALGGAAYVGLPYLSKALQTRQTRTTTPEANKIAKPAVPPRPVGALHVESTPPGAQVMVDGKPRGVSPATIPDLAPGRHEIVLKSAEGTVRKTVSIAAGETAEVSESIFSGWVVVYAPFEVTISEGTRVLRPDDRNQVMLPPGVHELRVTNRTLAYESAHRIEVKPGEGTTLQVTPPPSTLTVTAAEAAEVWLDGARLGDTPMSGAPVPLGTHELVVRRAAGGERRYTVTIGATPFTLNVDFR
jgi:PEGA domain